ncbi:hypothetical protein BDV3_001276 [Batrachochytrium dendrobatidis]
MFYLLPSLGRHVQNIIATRAARQFTDTHLDQVSRYIPQLSSLQLGGTSITQQGMIMFIQTTRSFKTLAYIDISNTPAVTDPVISTLASSLFDSLKTLDISHFRQSNISSKGASKLYTNTSICASLHILKLCGCTKLDDQALMVLGKNCKGLAGLDCSGAFLIGDVGVRAVLRGCMFLKDVGFAFCWRITDQAFAEAGEAIVADIDNGFVDVVGQYLENIQLQYCYMLSDRAVGYLSRLPSLKKVNLTKCSSVTSFAIERLGSRAIVAE